MRKLFFLMLAASIASPFAAAQNRNYQGPIPELAFNNTFRVICTCKNANTQNPYPWPPLEPPGYAAKPGVQPGTRAWTHTPKLRAQAGVQAPVILVRGVTQAIFVGAAVTNFSTAKFYQFKTGIAPATKDPTNKWKYTHATTGKDYFSVASAPVKITAWAIFEHAVTLTTPIPFQTRNEWLMFVEFKGGEWRDDPNGGQTIGHDWRGGPGPARGNFAGWTVGSNPRKVTPMGSATYRPKIGLLINEPVLTATGHHANNYYTGSTGPLAGEEYRGIGACKAPWSFDNRSNLWFSVRAGAKYGSTGRAIVFINFSRTWFPSMVPTQWGNLLLNPADPAMALLAGLPITLQKNGIFSSGDQNPIKIPPLGNVAKGWILKTQGLVYNAGFKDMALTTSSSILVE